MDAFRALLCQLDEGRFAPSDDFPDQTRIFVYCVLNSVHTGRLTVNEAATLWLYHLTGLGFLNLLDSQDLKLTLQPSTCGTVPVG